MDGALEQIAPRNSPGSLESVAVARRFMHGDGNVLGSSLGIRDQLLRKVDTEIRQDRGEFVDVRRRLGGATGHHDDGVVRGHASIRVNSVETHRCCVPQSRIKRRGGNIRIGGDENEHRRQAGSEHAGALGHPTHDVTVAFAYRGLGNGVGRHDRLGRALARHRRPIARHGHRRRISGSTWCPNIDNDGVDAGIHHVHREKFTDQTRRAHQDVTGADVPATRLQCSSSALGHGVAISEPLRSGARVRSPRIHDHRTSAAVGYDLTRPQHRSRRKAVAGEHSRRSIRWSIVDNDREVSPPRRLDARGYSQRPEPLRSGHTHGAIPMRSSPHASSRPSMRLAF